MERSMKLRGRVWLIDDINQQLIDDIDTDMIFHNKHLHITDIQEMAPYAFGNLDGWRDFPQKAQQDDILIVGKNFGAGSSRQQAVDCFAALGCQLIIGESFGAIYKRNAINSGMALIEALEISQDIAEKRLESGDTITIDLASGTLFNETKQIELRTAQPFFGVQEDIYKAGNLFAFAEQMNS